MGGEEGDCSLLWVSNCSSLLEIGKIFHYSLVLSVFFPWFMLSLSCYQSTNYFPSYFPYSYEEDEWKNCVLDVSHPSVWNHHTWSPAVFEMTSFNCWSRRTQVCTDTLRENFTSRHQWKATPIENNSSHPQALRVTWLLRGKVHNQRLDRSRSTNSLLLHKRGLS